MEADGYRCPPEFARRGRSISPQRQRPAQAKRSPSEEPKTSSQIEDLGKTVEAMKEFVDLEMARREAKEMRKREKEAAKKREEEERVAAEEIRAAEELKRQRKLEKQRRREADREAITKVVDVQVALRLKNIPEVLKNEVHHVVREIIPDLKGKGKVGEEGPSTSSSAEVLNAIEDITGETENLHISEKCKRGEDTPVGDSPYVTTPAKRTTKWATSRPLRLTERLCARNTQMKSAQVRMSRKALTGMKAALKDTKFERLQFLDSERRELINLHHNEIKAICGREGVVYKMKLQTIFDIADRRADVKFGMLAAEDAVVNLTSEFEEQADDGNDN
ncbi:hypothetical protein CBR_g24306 [Chara braunii]|uniref:Uncharacterized protein n=1 Tax=Chara braunii TaxID=69332 RepID=A0A388JMB7_CHABU|nr:hypothetical protein CBR_g24306 [Chara braunii]|eukprot:GBG58956.1 hypothetical protein CBR_g24306 [Chara braunii]